MKCTALQIVLAVLLFVPASAAWAQAVHESAIVSPLAVEKYKADRVDSLHQEDARAALVETVVDKGLLAVIVALVGYVISRSLDRYQTLLARSSAVEEKRFEIFDAVWTGLHECEHLERQLRALLQRPGLSLEDRRTVAERAEEIRERAGDVLQTIEQKMHWLGVDAERELRAYHAALIVLLDAQLQRRWDVVGRLDRELAKRKNVIADPCRISLGRFRSRRPSRTPG